MVGCWSILVLVAPMVLAQDLNIIPNLLRPYFENAEQHLPINFMANVSEKLFQAQKIGLSFEPIMLRNDYDFIIVGAGTAGSVIANRLSENPTWNILVLEAGQPESSVNFVPALAGYLARTSYDWGYIAESTPGSCLANENNRCPYNAGKALGGSSTTNYMLFTRGNRVDFDEWKEAGNEGWGYEDVLPYFKKFEAVNPDQFDFDYRGFNGEMSVGYPAYRSGLTDAFVMASKEAGYKSVDYNGEKQLGVSYIQANTLNGRRHSAASAFIHPIYKKRKNLHIITSALVSKVLLNEETKTAIGVEYIKDDKTHTVYAKKEVILSAGALKSPQLLMLSGIGPREDLEKIKIKVIQDLPVGKRFYDHMAFPVLVFKTNTTNLSGHIKRIGPMDLLEFMEGKGLLTTPLNVEGVLYGKRPNSSLHPEQPDFELLFLPGTLAGDLGTMLATAFRLKPEYYRAYYAPLESQRQDAFQILVHQMRPKSFGYLKLRDNKIESHPLFYHNFLTNPDDIEAQLAGIHEGIRIASTSVFKALGAEMYNQTVPGCGHLPFATDDYWRCAIPRTSSGTYHPTGTCRMGPSESEEAVVDNRLRVHGINRLRVADNSIIPSMVCAHTHAVALMIGEKFSDIIKEDWQDGT